MKRWLTSKDGVKYELNNVEARRFGEFEEKCKPHPCSLSIHNNNGIGWVIIAECRSLKIEKNITDYGTW